MATDRLRKGPKSAQISVHLRHLRAIWGRWCRWCPQILADRSAQISDHLRHLRAIVSGSFALAGSATRWADRSRTAREQRNHDNL